MAEHTPTPWALIDGDKRGHIESACKGFVRVPVAQAIGINSVAERAANAAFIVTACNSHEAMVKALKDMVNHFKPFTMKPIGSPGSAARLDQEMQIEIHKAARAALASAQGEKDGGSRG